MLFRSPENDALAPQLTAMGHTVTVVTGEGSGLCHAVRFQRPESVVVVPVRTVTRLRVAHEVQHRCQGAGQASPVQRMCRAVC